MVFEGFYESKINFTSLCPYILFWYSSGIYHAIKDLNFYKLRQWIFPGFSFYFKPLAKHLIDFSLLKSLFVLISRYQFPYLFHLQVPQWFSFSLFIEALREAFACFLDTYVSFQDLSFRKTLFFLGLLGYPILQPQLRSRGFHSQVFYLF